MQNIIEETAPARVTSCIRNKCNKCKRGITRPRLRVMKLIAQRRYYTGKKLASAKLLIIPLRRNPCPRINYRLQKLVILRRRLHLLRRIAVRGYQEKGLLRFILTMLQLVVRKGQNNLTEAGTNNLHHGNLSRMIVSDASHFQ